MNKLRVFTLIALLVIILGNVFSATAQGPTPVPAPDKGVVVVAGKTYKIVLPQGFSNVSVYGKASTAKDNIEKPVGEINGDTEMTVWDDDVCGWLQVNYGDNKVGFLYKEGVTFVATNGTPKPRSVVPGANPALPEGVCRLVLDDFADEAKQSYEGLTATKGQAIPDNVWSSQDIEVLVNEIFIAEASKVVMTYGDKKMETSGKCTAVVIVGPWKGRLRLTNGIVTKYPVEDSGFRPEMALAKKSYDLKSGNVNCKPGVDPVLYNQFTKPAAG